MKFIIALIIITAVVIIGWIATIAYLLWYGMYKEVIHLVAFLFAGYGIGNIVATIIIHREYIHDRGRHYYRRFASRFRRF